MNDIVEHLRSADAIYGSLEKLHEQAADEIERLREELDLLENKVNARDAELWEKTKKILFLREEVDNARANGDTMQKEKE